MTAAGVMSKKYGPKDDMTYLPDSIKKWAQIGTMAGHYDKFRCLTQDNDSGNSFETIADIIEKNYKKL